MIHVLSRHSGEGRNPCLGACDSLAGMDPALRRDDRAVLS
jgi:hypothetical protein